MVDIVKRYSWSYVSAIHTEGMCVCVLLLYICLSYTLTFCNSTFTFLSQPLYLRKVTNVGQGTVPDLFLSLLPFAASTLEPK